MRAMKKPENQFWNRMEDAKSKGYISLSDVETRTFIDQLIKMLRYTIACVKALQEDKTIDEVDPELGEIWQYIFGEDYEDEAQPEPKSAEQVEFEQRLQELESRFNYTQAQSKKEQESLLETIKALKSENTDLHRDIVALTQSSELAPGWVYLVREKNDGHYKIGKSIEPFGRIKKFEVKLPFKVEAICEIRCTNHHKMERDLHQMFADKRVDGEWFALSDEDVSYIKSLA